MAPKRTEAKEAAAAPQAKRAKKDPAAEKVKKQLNEITNALSFAGLSQEVKTVLNEVLPFSLGEFSDKRHKFQEQVVQAISDILEEREAVLSKAVEDARSNHDDAVSTMPEREHMASEAEAALEAEKAEEQRLKIALAETAFAFKRAKQSVAEAEEAKRLHSLKSQEAAEKKGHCEAALADLKVLKTASPEDDVSRAKLEKLIKLLKEYKFDESMMIAVPAALAKAPDARGEFDHMAVEQLDVEIGKMIDGQEAILSAARPGEEQCEAVCKEAHDELSKAKDDQKVAAGNYIKTNKQKAARAEALSAAKTAVQELTRSVGQLKKTIDEASIEVELFEQGPKEAFNALRSRATPVAVNAEELPTEEQAMETREPEATAVAVC